MLYEDWWINADGAVKQMRQSEHAEEALRYLLKLPEDFRIPRTRLFTGISMKEEDAARKKGVAENVLAYLTRDTIDPRTWMVQKEGWIRVSKNKMNLWAFDDKTLDLIRNSAYWENQPQASPLDMIEIDELSSNQPFEVPVRALRNPNATAAAIKEIAYRHGTFDLPAQELPKPYMRPGGFTDKSGDGRWLYQRIGENPEE